MDPTAEYSGCAQSCVGMVGRYFGFYSVSGIVVNEFSPPQRSDILAFDWFRLPDLQPLDRC